jgi:hypothetical protein
VKEIGRKLFNRDEAAAEQMKQNWDRALAPCPSSSVFGGFVQER